MQPLCTLNTAPVHSEYRPCATGAVFIPRGCNGSRSCNIRAVLMHRGGIHAQGGYSCTAAVFRLHRGHTPLPSTSTSGGDSVYPLLNPHIPKYLPTPKCCLYPITPSSPQIANRVFCLFGEACGLTSPNQVLME